RAHRVGVYFSLHHCAGRMARLSLHDALPISFPMDWVKNEEGRLSDSFKQLKPHMQYIALAAAEASNIRFNTQPALSLGLNYWNLEQLKAFWQFTAIRRKNAM